MITSDWSLLEAILDFPDFEKIVLPKPQLQNIVLIIGMVVSLKLITVNRQENENFLAGFNFR